jgi:hypothetical protein
MIAMQREEFLRLAGSYFAPEEIDFPEGAEFTLEQAYHALQQGMASKKEGSSLVGGQFRFTGRPSRPEEASLDMSKVEYQ